MPVQFTNELADLANAKIDRTNWAGMTTQQKRAHLELEGFVVLPDMLSPEQLSAIRAELARLPTKGMDYSEHQRGFTNVQWANCPTATQVVDLPQMVEFLSGLFGDELVCTSCTYAESRPGHPGIAIHTDAQPYGSKIFGVQASCACLVRVLYYLDDLIPTRSPLKVIPRSHLSLHADGNPYRRYLRHPDEVMVCCKAGSAAIINQKIFHANYPNFDTQPRRLLAIAYRPAWAGPISDVPEHDPALVATLPPNIRAFFKSPNTRNIDYDQPNRPDNMATDAPGLNTGKWA